MDVGPSVLGSEDLEPTFKPGGSVQKMQNVPRFGHSSDFALLFSDEDDQEDYIVGLIFAACLVFAFFIIWTLFVIIFKCMGKARVGFLAGGPFVQPSPARSYGRPSRVRSVFLTSGLLIMVFGVLLVTQGLDNLEQTVHTLDDSNQDVKSILADADMIMENLEKSGEKAKAYRSSIQTAFGNGDFCPQDPNIDENVGVSISSEVDDTVTQLNALEDFITSDATEVEEGVVEAMTTTTDIDDAVTHYNENEWVGIIIIVVLVVLPAFLVIGALMAHCDASFRIYSCFLSWVILPLFFLLITLCWILCGLFAIAASANADFCLGGRDETPAGTIERIMEEEGIDSSDIRYRALVFYARECSSDDPFNFLGQYKVDLNDAQNRIGELQLSIMAAGVEVLNNLCDDDFDIVNSLLAQMIALVLGLLEQADLAISLLRCERIAPLYQQVVNQGVCTYSASGFAWVFSSLLVISICGMLMITFRASLYKEDPYDYDHGMESGAVDDLYMTESPKNDSFEPAPSPRSHVGEAYVEDYEGSPDTSVKASAWEHSSVQEPPPMSSERPSNSPPVSVTGTDTFENPFASDEHEATAGSYHNASAPEGSFNASLYGKNVEKF